MPHCCDFLSFFFQFNDFEKETLSEYRNYRLKITKLDIKSENKFSEDSSNFTFQANTVDVSRYQISVKCCSASSLLTSGIIYNHFSNFLYFALIIWEHFVKYIRNMILSGIQIIFPAQNSIWLGDQLQLICWEGHL